MGAGQGVRSRDCPLEFNSATSKHIVSIRGGIHFKECFQIHVRFRKQKFLGTYDKLEDAVEVIQSEFKNEWVRSSPGEVCKKICVASCLATESRFLRMGPRTLYG